MQVIVNEQKFVVYVCHLVANSNACFHQHLSRLVWCDYMHKHQYSQLNVMGMWLQSMNCILQSVSTDYGQINFRTEYNIDHCSNYTVLSVSLENVKNDQLYLLNLCYFSKCALVCMYMQSDFNCMLQRTNNNIIIINYHDQFTWLLHGHH